MPFTLYVTFSGMCMVTHRAGELRVLMPRLGGHEPVVGSHVRFQPPVTDTARFRHGRIKNGRIDLSLQTDDPLSTDLGRLDLLNLSRITRRPTARDKARVQVVLKAGSLCDPAVCEFPLGARWKIKVGTTEETRQMTTALHWRIANVRNTVGSSGEEGLVVPFLGMDDKPHELVLRPVEINGDRQIRMYFYHTPPDEHPSSRPPRHARIKKGEKNPHFHAYYRLYDHPRATPALKFVDDGATFGEKLLRMGRRLTCVVVEGDP